MFLVQKWPFLQSFFLDNIGQKNVFYVILKRKNQFSRLQKQEVKKLERMTFFQRG